MFDAPDTPDGRVHALVNLLGTARAWWRWPVLPAGGLFARFRHHARGSTGCWCWSPGRCAGACAVNAGSFGAYGAAILRVSVRYRDILFGAAGEVLRCGW
jgi:hypothetical protein